MYKREIKEAFSKLQASEQLMMEVLDMKQVTKQSRSIGRIVGRVAACAATVALVIGMVALMWPGEEKTGNQLEKPTSGMTAAPTLPTDVPPETLPKKIYAESGILKVYACDAENVGSIELQEHELFEEDFRWRAVWAMTINDSMDETPHFGRPITFQIPKDLIEMENITLVVSSEQEGFCEGVTLKMGESLYLTKQVDTFAKHRIWKEKAGKDIYLDVIVYADDKIVGYGVISFYMCEDNAVCYAYKAKTVCFLNGDGELQPISEEYAREQIASYKQTQKDDQGAEFFDKLHEKC